ncbi:high mobility group box-domain-containing protein [Xylaria sp. FL1777]|nr:high mobility group box-domain-containing protein [Xylaria sp. FL1777]
MILIFSPLDQHCYILPGVTGWLDTQRTSNRPGGLFPNLETLLTGNLRKMSSFNGFPHLAVSVILDQVAAQLDGTTAVVKIPTATFSGLDKNGEEIIKREVSLALGHPVEFYFDQQNDKRVYLANIASINLHRPCVARIIPGLRLPMLFQVAVHCPEVINHPSGGIQHFQSMPSTQAPQPSLPPAPLLEAKTSLKRARASETTKEAAESGSESGTARKKSKISDLKSPNSFFLFRQHECAILAKENPGMWNGDISKALGEKWNAMKPEEKEPWKLKAAELRAQRRNSIANLDQAKGKEQTSNKEPPQRGSEHHGMHQHVDRQYPQVYQTSLASLEHSVQLPVYNTPQSMHSQAHGRGSLSLSSVSSGSTSSSYFSSEYSAQSQAYNSLDISGENSHDKPQHIQAPEVPTAQNLQQVPIDNTIENPGQSWYPPNLDVTDPSLPSSAQVPENELPAIQEQPVNENDIFYGAFEEDGIWDLVNFEFPASEQTKD